MSPSDVPQRPVGTKSGGIHIVLNLHAHPELLEQLGAELKLLDAEVHGVRDGSGGAINRTGNADADRTEFGDGDAGEVSQRRDGATAVATTASGP